MSYSFIPENIRPLSDVREENGRRFVYANDLRKGDVVFLRNGWRATIADNRKGITRMAEVFGYETETGSIYAHDISSMLAQGEDAFRPHIEVRLTPAQRKQADRIRAAGL